MYPPALLRKPFDLVKKKKNLIKALEIKPRFVEIYFHGHSWETKTQVIMAYNPEKWSIGKYVSMKIFSSLPGRVTPGIVKKLLYRKVKRSIGSWVHVSILERLPHLC